VAVPAEYFSALDASGKRYDADQRPELSKGTVDFLAPAEYMVRPPMPPCYFFLIDVSLASVQCGLLEVCLPPLAISKNKMISPVTFGKRKISLIYLVTELVFSPFFRGRGGGGTPPSRLCNSSVVYYN
jgi:protein transport protein SEC24